MDAGYIQLLVIKDEISKQPAELQAAIHAAADEIRAITKREDGSGMMALAFVGAEIAAE
jgi:hypothetical protein